jgi:hypothetical protein
MPLTKRDRWEMEEREFTMAAVVTKVYCIDVRVMAASDEEARAKFAELHADIAIDCTDDKLEEVIVEEEGCYDPLTSLDD